MNKYQFWFRAIRFWDMAFKTAFMTELKIRRLRTVFRLLYESPYREHMKGEQMHTRMAGIKVDKKLIILIFISIRLFSVKLMLASDKCESATFLSEDGINSMTTNHCAAAEYVPSSPYPASFIITIVLAQLVIEYVLSCKAIGSVNFIIFLYVFFV